MKPNGKPGSFYLARAVAITLDLLIFILAVVTLVFIEFYAENVKRGFFCRDPTISFKYQKDTISIKTIIVYALTPIIVLWLVEFIFHSRPNSGGCVVVDDDQNNSPPKAIAAWRQALKWFADYGINLVLMLLVMDTTKIFIGGHRPHFLDTCMPDAAMNCTRGEFITEYTCLNQRLERPSRALRDASRSFPSGHASITMYTTVFLIWYLHSRVPKIQSLFLIPFLQSLLMIWTCFCCLSRITDHRHHWYDVVGGAVLGGTFAVCTCFILSRKFIESQSGAVTQSSKSSSTTTNNNRCAGEQRLLPPPSIIVKEEFTMNNLE